MTSTALVPSTPLAQSPGGRIISKLNVKLGRLELVPGELRFYQKHPLFAAFGLIGALLGMRSKGKVTLTVALATVRTLGRGSFGRNKNILELACADGTAHRLMVDDFDRFTAALRDQLAAHGTVAATGDAAWAVTPA